MQFPQFQTQPPTQTPDTDGPIGAMTLMLVAICCGVLGALGGFHTGLSRNDIVLARSQAQAQEASENHATCQAWIETQKQRIESFYTEYMGLNNDDTNQ